MVGIGHDLLKNIIAVVGGHGLAGAGVERDDGQGVAYRIGLVDCDEMGLEQAQSKVA